jgi:hypothetical protein
MKRMVVGPDEYRDIDHEGTVFVTTKTDEVHEIVNVKVSDTHISGDRVLRDDKGKRVGLDEVKISLDEVRLVEVQKEGVEGKKIALWSLAGVGILALALLVTCGIIIWVVPITS